MRSLTTVRFSAHRAEHSSVQYPLSRTQYRPSRTQYPLSRHLLLLMIPTIIPPNSILRIFPTTRFLLCFVILWILLASATHSSKYTMFHVRQALKITVVSILSVFVIIIPILGWIAFPILQVILWVIKIISFFQICSGKAKEPAIVRSFGFLR